MGARRRRRDQRKPRHLGWGAPEDPGGAGLFLLASERRGDGNGRASRDAGGSSLPGMRAARRRGDGLRVRAEEAAARFSVASGKEARARKTARNGR